MPIKDGVDIGPDAAHEAGLCPECGRDYATLNAEEHISAHWPRPFDMSDEAKRRAKLIRSAFQGGLTFDKPEPPAKRGA